MQPHTVIPPAQDHPKNPRIVLLTLNAKYSHASLGLRYLLANLPADLRQQAVLCEYTINEAPALIAEKLLERYPSLCNPSGNPQQDTVVIGMGVYIWNIRETEQLAAILRGILPHAKIVLGGPEVSFPPWNIPIIERAHHVITGEADRAFAGLCRALLSPDSLAASETPQNIPHIIHADKPEVDILQFPYDYYTDEDLKQRIIYVEASRGCPFTCEFCLSSLDNGVRAYDVDLFLQEMEKLLERGCRTFKFVDRTFNLSPQKSAKIVSFFLERLPKYNNQLFLHFEMVPDRLPDNLKQLLEQFPKGCIQFEIGIQSFSPEVGTMISRKMNAQKTEENFQYLLANTGVHIHADLIVGLPAETIQSFAEGFNRLWYMGGEGHVEIQIGILKLLKGTPIARHIEAEHMIFSPIPPYDILQNRHINYQQMQQFKRFAKYFDLFVNSGKFSKSIRLMIRHFYDNSSHLNSPFAVLWHLSDWVWKKTGLEHGINQVRQYQLLYQYAIEHGVGHEAGADLMAKTLAEDYASFGEKKHIPDFLRAAADKYQIFPAHVYIPPTQPAATAKTESPTESQTESPTNPPEPQPPHQQALQTPKRMRRLPVVKSES